MISRYQTYIASVHGYGASILPLYQQRTEIPKKEERRIEELTKTPQGKCGTLLDILA